MDSAFKLQPLPLEKWIETKRTLHRFVQIVGKIKLALTPYRNHWWNVALHVNARGIGTTPMPFDNKIIDINFDFCTHQLVINTSRSEVETITLFDGLCVSEFYVQVVEAFSRIGIELKILAKPFGIEPSIPFAEDNVHCSYKSDDVYTYWQILCFADSVLKEFSGKFIGKCSPVHLFWHSLDLTVSRYSGKKAPSRLDGKVNQQAYSHEESTAGFWPGDDNVKEPAFYSYTYPSPPDIDKEPLLPEGRAKWINIGGSPEAILPYATLLEDPDPRRSLLQFLESSFAAGAKLAEWDMNVLSVQDA